MKFYPKLISSVIINLILGCLLSGTVMAQQIDISSSLNPVGSGARATGMGGAFIGVSDDATAASWNPAGLVQLEKPEISGAYAYFDREQTYSSSVHPEIASDNTMSTKGLNFASLVYPFNMLQRNMVLSLNYQRLFEMNKEVDFILNRDVMGFTLTDNIEFDQEGYLYALAPAYAIQITPALSAGVALNIWDDLLGRNGWESSYSSLLSGLIGANPIEIKFIQKEDVSFEGLNMHAGFLWQINGSWTLGGVYKSAFEAELEKKTFFRQIPSAAVTTTETLDMQMPASFGLGIAFRHSDNWTTALDVYRTDWSDFVITNESGNEINPLDGSSINSGRLKDTTQVRFGIEYLLIKQNYLIPVRGGLFYDPEPSTGGLDEFYGFSLGTGYSRGKVVLDIAYRFRTGNNVSGDIPSIEGSSADIRNHTIMCSAIYYPGD